MSLRAAVINMRCGGDITANLSQSETLIRAAHKDGAQLISTPENTLMMQENTKGMFAALKPEAETLGVPFFSALAKELGIDLHIGSMAVRASADKAANRSYVFGAEGQVKARYDKIHMFDVTINEVETWRESASYQAGDTPVMTDVGGFKLGLSICYDVRFADLYKYYAAHGAHVLAVPAAFTAVTGEAHWRTLLRARAIETSAYVMAAAQGGYHANGRATWGHSMIVDPWGEVIAEIPNDEPGFVCADLSLGKVDDIRARIPAWANSTPLPRA